MDSFCRLIADNLPTVIVNINYTKIDEQPFPYQQVELCDAVLYFAGNADQYDIDKTKFAIGGYSAGAHIAAGAAIRLKELGSTFLAKCLFILSLILHGEKREIRRKLKKKIKR